MAVRLGIVATNVCDMVTPPRVRHREMTTWDAAQARRFLAVAETGSAYLRRDFMRLAQRAGVPVIRIHDQRHTYATLGLATGASLKALSESMGHAQTSITINTYAHALPHQRREVADKVGDVLFGETPQREPGQASADHS